MRRKPYVHYLPYYQPHAVSSAFRLNILECLSTSVSMSLKLRLSVSSCISFPSSVTLFSSLLLFPFEWPRTELDFQGAGFLTVAWQHLVLEFNLRPYAGTELSHEDAASAGRAGEGIEPRMHFGDEFRDHGGRDWINLELGSFKWKHRSSKNVPQRTWTRY